MVRIKLGKNIVMETIFTSRLRQDKQGRFYKENSIHTTYRNEKTGRFVSKKEREDLEKDGYKFIKSTMSVASSNYESLFKRAEKAASGTITPKQLTSWMKKFEVGVEIDKQIFYDNLNALFEDMFPTSRDRALWDEAMGLCTPDELQRWYDRNQTFVNQTFQAYRNQWVDDGVGYIDELEMAPKRSALIRSLRNWVGLGNE